MDKKKSSSDDPDRLGARLKEARRVQDEKRIRPRSEATSWGIATRFVGDLVSGMVVGGFIGWLLDRALDTKPWMLIVFLVLGVVAGIMNVMRSARELNDAARHRNTDDESD